MGQPASEMSLLRRIIAFWVICYVLITAFTVFLVVVHNAWAWWCNEPPVSAIIRKLAVEEPMLVFVFGLSVGALAAHLFWPIR